MPVSPVGFDLFSHAGKAAIIFCCNLILIGGTLTFYIELAVLQRYGAVVSSQISYTISSFCDGAGGVIPGRNMR
jgi:hypothetical protein